eukprot:9224270-Pyramimonas_sp.AAC.1
MPNTATTTTTATTRAHKEEEEGGGGGGMGEDCQVRYRLKGAFNSRGDLGLGGRAHVADGAADAVLDLF